MRILNYLIELFGVATLIGAFAFISWTKMALGGALAVIGAFFPSLRDARQTPVNEGKVAWHNLLVSFKGGIRVLVVFAGITLIVGAVADAKDEEAIAGRRAVEKGLSHLTPKMAEAVQEAVRAAKAVENHKDTANIPGEPDNSANEGKSQSH